VPALHAAVLRHHSEFHSHNRSTMLIFVSVWLHRDDVGDNFSRLLERFEDLPPSGETKVS
jgi:hypothetical protein